MKIRTFLAATALGLAGLIGNAAASDVPAIEAAPPPVAFTDSTAAGLAGTKRVAISSVVVSFQASTGELKTGTNFIPFAPGGHEKVQSVLAMPDMDPALQDAIVAEVYRNLKAELTKAGYEVVPEAQVRASANYQAILKQGGFVNHSKFANAMGDTVLVSPAGLQPYTPYIGEMGAFAQPATTYMSWVSGIFRGSATPGGLTNMQQTGAWKIPGLEVALAKELNAHVVKAHYVVSLGKAAVKRRVHYGFSEDPLGDPDSNPFQGRRHVGAEGTLLAQAGLVADQTHIAFRSPNGNPKWQKVAATKIVPPKDGDVVVRIAAPLLGGTEYFALEEGEFKRAGGLFSAQKRGDVNILGLASLTDPAAYARDVVQMMWLSNAAMLGLVPAS